MPFTLSHPLAVIPFRRWCPAWLNFAALVIGSMSPDFGYFINQFDAAAYAHSIVGTFLICLPTGLLALGIFYALRKPLCFILPEPHRGVLMPLAMTPITWAPRTFLVAAASILIGAWTHTIWDSFTHSYGWPVHEIEFLHSPQLHIGEREIPGHKLLQHSSTIVGGLGLILLYFLWLRRQTQVPSAHDKGSDRWRYVLVGAVALASTAIAIASMLGRAQYLDDEITFHYVAYWCAVYFVATFFPLFVIGSLTAYALRSKPGNAH
jgi:hypothetical protein